MNQKATLGSKELNDKTSCHTSLAESIGITIFSDMGYDSPHYFVMALTCNCWKEYCFLNWICGEADEKNELKRSKLHQYDKKCSKETNIYDAFSGQYGPNNEAQFNLHLI